MQAYELLAKLRCLTLTEENGKMAWIGTNMEWEEVHLEEQDILFEWTVKKLLA